MQGGADIDVGGGRSSDCHVRSVMVFQNELFEEGLSVGQFATVDQFKAVGSVVGLTTAQIGDFFQSLRTEQRQIDRRAKRHQSLICADVAHGTGASNVLLSCLQVQKEAAFAFTIDGLTDQTARHFSDELLAAGKNSQKRAAELKGRSQ